MRSRASLSPCHWQVNGRADRAAAHAEPFGERTLGRQRLAGRERAVENQLADAVGNLVGHPRLRRQNVGLGSDRKNKAVEEMLPFPLPDAKFTFADESGVD